MTYLNLPYEISSLEKKISTAYTTPSLSSSSSTVIKKPPHCVSLKKYALTGRGFKSFEDWNSDPNHIYIGRDMSHYVPEALGSKWGNPFRAKKSNKNSLNKCLKRYEDRIRKDPHLFNAVMELEGKELGCWCKPSPCHGDILIKLFKERQAKNSCSKSKFTLENGENIVGQSSGILKNVQSIYSPFTEEGDTSCEQGCGRSLRYHFTLLKSM